MAQLDDIEFQKISSLVRQFGWEVVKQEIQNNDLVVLLRKKRPAEAIPPGAAEAPPAAIPT